MSINNKYAYQEPHEGQVSQFMVPVRANGVVELGWIAPNSIVTGIGGANLGAGTATFSYDGGPSGSVTGSVAAGNYFPSQVRVIATIASLPANQNGWAYVTYVCYDPFKE